MLRQPTAEGEPIDEQHWLANPESTRTIGARLGKLVLL